MNKILSLILFFSAMFFVGTGCSEKSDESEDVDICIYGASSAGVMAAYTAKMQKKSVLLLEPGKHLGGLTTGGLGFTDIGNKYAISGLSRDFYRRIGKHYGKLEQWIFEPHVAENIFRGYLEKAGVEPRYEYELKEVEKDGSRISAITVDYTDGNGNRLSKKIRARMFIDCTYEGDLMAKAGVPFIVGREANSQYNETWNGVQLRHKHQFPDGIDPYKVPGNPESGLLWGISAEPLDSNGTGDRKVQAYNYRICLSNRPENMIPIEKPEDYDSSKYELLLRLMEKKVPGDLWGFLKFDLMPNGKTDINNNGPFSTDMIGENYDYPEADWPTRRRILRKHENYTKGLLYFIGHDPRMPEHLREQMLKWGYPKDEYVNNGHWSPQLYVREARRMIGAYVMTQANCEGGTTVADGVGMAAYTMDSHNCQRVVHNGMVKNEGDVQIGGFGPYPISYRSIIPKAEHCENLFVPVCLSASHIAYGSIRMEPVFMVLAQSAAMAASMAIDGNISVQDVPVAQLQRMLRADPLADGSTAEILVDNGDPEQVRMNGKWITEKNTRGAYGPSLFSDTSKGLNPASVRFSPELKTGGRYRVYAYVPMVAGISSEIPVKISDGRKETSHTIRISDIRVEGQTAGEWAELGVFDLPEGKKSYVEIFNQGANGKVVADAVLFVPQY